MATQRLHRRKGLRRLPKGRKASAYVRGYQNGSGQEPDPPEGLSHLNDNGGGIIAAGAFEGGADEALGGRRGGLDGVGAAQEVEKLFVEEAIDEAVGAEEEDVAGFVGDGANLGIDKLVAAAEGLLQGGAARMLAGLAFAELSVAVEPADVGVVLAELLDFFAGRGKVINPAVADMGEVHPAGREPAEAQRGLHTVDLLVAGANEDKRAVDLLIELFGSGIESDLLLE